MTCTAVFTISDGAKTITVRAASVSDQFGISRQGISDGVTPFRAVDGSATQDIQWLATRYTISGAGPCPPGLWPSLTGDASTLAMQAAYWTVEIPGFEPGSATESWTVLPAFPQETRERIGRAATSWSLTLETTEA